MPRDEQRYERWRQQWLCGGSSQAVTVLMFHGLFKALTVTARPLVHTPVPACHNTDEIVVLEPVLSAAAQCVRRLLNQPCLEEAV